MKNKLKIRYILVCHKCFRMCKAFVPIPNKDGNAIIWCTTCDIVLMRFDQGKEEYMEEYDDEE